MQLSSLCSCTEFEYDVVGNESHAQIQKVLTEGTNTTLTTSVVFLQMMRGERDPNNSTKLGPSAARQRNAILLAGRFWPNIECWLGSFAIFQGIRTWFAKELNSFVIL